MHPLTLTLSPRSQHRYNFGILADRISRSRCIGGWFFTTTTLVHNEASAALTSLTDAVHIMVVESLLGGNTMLHSVARHMDKLVQQAHSSSLLTL